MSNCLKRFSLFVVCCLVSGLAAADTFYATPSGAGSKNGTSWSNAIDETQIQSFFNNSMGAGDTLQLGSGTYDLPDDGSGNRLKIYGSGTSSADKVLMGVDTGAGRPLLLGDWSVTSPETGGDSASGIWINTNVKYITFTGFDIYGMKLGVITSSSGGISDITFSDLNIQNTNTGFYLRGVSSSIIEECTISQYHKRGVRFVSGCSFIEVENVQADCNLGNTSWPTNYPAGFGMDNSSTVHDITYRYCVSRNNYFPLGTSYWNGDGFVAENSVYNIAYYNCEAYDNTDGGWDEKSKAAYLENCISMRNKRNYRVWNVNGSKISGGTGEYTRLVNCIGAYASSAGGSGSVDCFWTNGLVDVQNSTFHNGPSNAVHVEYYATHNTIAVFTDCIISQDNVYGTGNITLHENNTTITLVDTATYKAGVSGTEPNYLSPSQGWEGDPANAYNNQTYGSSKGYYMASDVLVEAGQVEWTQDSGWKTVILNATFANPVVVMSPVSANGADPCHARVRNVTASSFEFTVEEWDYLDGVHTADETLYYLVVEEGTHTIGGLTWEAGIASVNQNWNTISLSSSFSYHAILPQIVTVNDSASANIRMRNANGTGFQIMVDEEEAADGVHANETVHYIVVNGGSGSESGLDFAAGVTGDSYTDQPSSISFGGTYSNSAFFAQMRTTDGSDSSGLRVVSKTDTSASIFVEEELSLDEEIAHTDEKISWFVIELN